MQEFTEPNLQSFEPPKPKLTLTSYDGYTIRNCGGLSYIWKNS